MGGKDQQPSAYSPRTGLFYVPTNNICMNYEGVEVKYTAGAPYVGANVLMFPGRGGHLGEFIAWDATTGKKVWGIKESQPAWSGPWPPPATWSSTAPWTNIGELPHTATAEKFEWDTGDINPGESKSVTFNEPGNYYYICKPHPWMYGQVVVEQ
jgi:glucose dehydrogenase